MTTIFDIYETVNFVTDKLRRGFLSPEDVSKAADFGQNQLFGVFIQQAQNGDEVANAALRPFQKILTASTNGLGVLAYPADFSMTDTIYTTISNKKRSLRETLFNEVDAVVNSKIYPIASNPAFTEDATGIKVYPEAVTAVEWHYKCRPTTPVIGYTVPGKVPVYDPGTSVQLMFGREYWFSIILKGLPMIGVNLSDQEVSSLNQLFTNTPTAAQ